MAAFRQSDRVRGIVLKDYFEPEIRSGKTLFGVRARDIQQNAEAVEGFPRGRTPLICNVLQSDKLISQGQELLQTFVPGGKLIVDHVEGPPSRQSKTVVVYYRVVTEGVEPTAASPKPTSAPAIVETPEERARRVTDGLCGLLRDELAHYGGAEGFVRWIRRDEDQKDTAA